MKKLIILLLFITGCTGPTPFSSGLVCVDGVLYVQESNGTLIQARFYENNKCIPAQVEK